MYRGCICWLYLCLSYSCFTKATVAMLNLFPSKETNFYDCHSCMFGLRGGDSASVPRVGWPSTLSFEKQLTQPGLMLLGSRRGMGLEDCGGWAVSSP